MTSKTMKTILHLVLVAQAWGFMPRKEDSCCRHGDCCGHVGSSFSSTVAEVVPGNFVLIMGPPNAGKGTHSDLVSNKIGIDHFATGDFLRIALKSNPEALAIMKSGGLVPDEMVMLPVRQQLALPEYESGVLLDGFPRTVSQAVMFDKYLNEEKNGARISMVIVLKVKCETLVNRAITRWINPSSGASYSSRSDETKPNSLKAEEKKRGKGWNIDPRSPTYFETLKPYMLDNETGEQLVRRADDTEATCGTRIKNFWKETNPVIEHYKNKDVGTELPIVVEVDGELPMPRIHDILVSEIEKRFPDTKGKMMRIPQIVEWLPVPSLSELISNPKKFLSDAKKLMSDAKFRSDKVEPDRVESEQKKQGTEFKQEDVNEKPCKEDPQFFIPTEKTESTVVQARSHSSPPRMVTQPRPAQPAEVVETQVFSATLPRPLVVPADAVEEIPTVIVDTSAVTEEKMIAPKQGQKTTATAVTLALTAHTPQPADKVILAVPDKIAGTKVAETVVEKSVEKTEEVHFSYHHLSAGEKAAKKSTKEGAAKVEEASATGIVSVTTLAPVTAPTKEAAKEKAASKEFLSKK